MFITSTGNFAWRDGPELSANLQDWQVITYFCMAEYRMWKGAAVLHRAITPTYY